MTNNKE